MPNIVIDRLGDLADDLIKRCWMSNISPWHLCVIDPIDRTWTMPCNPFLDSGEPHAVADGFVDAVRRHSSSWGVEIDQNLRHIVHALVQARQSPLEVDRVFTDAEFRRSLIRKLSDVYTRDFFERLDRASNERRTQWHLAISNKLSPFLFNPHLRRMLASSSSISFEKVLGRAESIVLIYLRREKLHGAGDLLGDLLLQKIWQAVQARGAPSGPSRTTLFLDEFQHFAHGCVGDMITLGRHYGLRLVAAHQTQAQLDPETRAILRNNAAVRVIFNVGPVDAKEIAPELFEWNLAAARAELLRLRTGEAYVARRGQHPVRVCTPDIERNQYPGREVDVADYRELALQWSNRSVAEVDREIDERYQLRQPAQDRVETAPQEVRHVRAPFQSSTTPPRAS